MALDRYYVENKYIYNKALCSDIECFFPFNWLSHYDSKTEQFSECDPPNIYNWSLVQYIQYNRVHTVNYLIVCTVQYITVQYNTFQYNEVKNSSVFYNTLH